MANFTKGQPHKLKHVQMYKFLKIIKSKHLQNQIMFSTRINFLKNHGFILLYIKIHGNGKNR